MPYITAYRIFVTKDIYLQGGYYVWVSLPDGIEAKGSLFTVVCTIYLILNIAAILDECKKEHSIKFHIGPKYVCGV